MSLFNFYTIIGSSKSHHKKLRIPPAFNRRFQNRAAGYCKLILPSGATWDVQIFKENKALYFGEGWAAFMKHNSIRNGYFLEFEYLRKLEFKVRIFNLTCCEIDYLLHNDHAYSSEDDDLMEEDSDEDSDVASSRASFTREVLLCHVAGAHYMHLPPAFVQKYMRGHLSSFVKLQVQDGRVWHVSCYKASNGLQLKGPTWMKFAEENKWRMGELYKFSFVREEADCLVLKVEKEGQSCR